MLTAPKKREADFGILFRHWLKANPLYSCACELKQTTGTSIPLSCVEEHQLAWLQALSSDKGALIRVQGSSGEPDYVYLRNAPAYVFIKFPKAFYGITVGTFILEKERSKRRSLTEGRAREISVISVRL